VPLHEYARDKEEVFNSPVSDAISGILAEDGDQTLLRGLPVNMVVFILGEMEAETLINEVYGQSK
jgi:hypothetical protein